jgi:2-phospho-L-lactate/phosphoenolpyruvate guanylyltransferase
VPTAAILPVKRLSSAKQRLAGSVADPFRARLARAMVSDVLSALSRTSSIAQVIVVTAEPTVASDARAHGALVLEDRDESGQSAAVAIGVKRAIADGYERALCVPGDCPTLEPDELDRLLADADRAGGRIAARGEVVIVPDRHGTGTNALLLCPPDAIAPSFGPGSCERHGALARAAGVRWRLEHPPSLLLDVDTGEDLSALRGALAGARASAVRTRSVLEQQEGVAVLSVATRG